MRIGAAYLGLCVLLCGSSASAESPLGSGFTYQGNLEKYGLPLNDTAKPLFSPSARI